MSFSGDVKRELCALQIEKGCCALAELYGIVLFASVCTPREVRMITGNTALPQRIDKLCAQMQPPVALHSCTASAEDARRQSYVYDDRTALAVLFTRFGYDVHAFVALHLNGWLLEEDCCRAAFLRGAFLTGGYIAEPDKMYYLELKNNHRALIRALEVLLDEMGVPLRVARRRSGTVMHTKESERIEDILTLTGAHKCVLRLMEIRVIKEMRNDINRRVNCETANLMKAAGAGAEQEQALLWLQENGLLDTLPEPLREAAALRLQYPDEPIAALAARAVPPVSKPGFHHRLTKLRAIAREAGADAGKGDSA